ncbi:MAG: TlpA disulfide reductase family protein [Candidatus Rokuibacteriota bacterium]
MPLSGILGGMVMARGGAALAAVVTALVLGASGFVIDAPAGATAPRMTVDEAMQALELIRPARGKAAGDFTLPLVDGQRFRLSEHQGRPVFINFWATWCPPCLEELPAMERLWREHKERGLVMVAVSLDANPKVVAPFIAKHGFTFPVAIDSRLDVANAYGVRALPATVLVDRQGQLAALALGPRAWDNAAAHALIGGLTGR